MGVDEGKYELKPYYKGQVIYKEGQAAATAYLVKTGTVVLFKAVSGKRTIQAKLKAGQIFGEMGVISGEARTTGAVAYEYSEVVVINQKALSYFLKKSPPIIHALTKTLIGRLKQTGEDAKDHGAVRVFMSVCNIIEIMDTAHRHGSANGSRAGQENGDGVDCAEITRRVKAITKTSQLEIDTIIKKLRSINLVEVTSQKQARQRKQYLKISDPENFIKTAHSFFEEWKGVMGFSGVEQEYLDIADFAEMVKSTPQMIYKKIGAEEIPENIFFINRAGAVDWTKEVGEDFFKRVKRKRVKIEDLQDANDIVYVDNATLQEVISQIGHYKLGILAAMAGEEAREKIFKNMSSKMAGILKEEMPVEADLDEIEAADVEDEVIGMIKSIKQSKGAPK